MTPGRALAVENATRERTLAEAATVADGWWSRLRGLLFRPPLEEGEGLLIVPCRGVHTFGMSYPIDVLFLDAERRVTAVEHGLEPWRATGIHGDARSALELPAGTASATGTEVGDRLSWDGTDG